MLGVCGDSTQGLGKAGVWRANVLEVNKAAVGKYASVYGAAKSARAQCGVRKVMVMLNKWEFHDDHGRLKVWEGAYATACAQRSVGNVGNKARWGTGRNTHDAQCARARRSRRRLLKYAARVGEGGRCYRNVAAACWWGQGARAHAV